MSVQKRHSLCNVIKANIKGNYHNGQMGEGRGKGKVKRGGGEGIEEGGKFGEGNGKEPTRQ